MSKGDREDRKREREMHSEREREEMRIMRADNNRSATQRYEQGGKRRNTKTIKTIPNVKNSQTTASFLSSAQICRSSVRRRSTNGGVATMTTCDAVMLTPV